MKKTPLDQKPLPKRRRVMIEVDAALFDEVEHLLKTPEGIALFGKNTDMRRRMGIAAGSWMTNVTYGLPGGSGLRRACGLAPLVRGGRS